MLKFKTLSIRNFFSYGNQVTVFDLTTPGITMIVGENLDDTSEGKAANGVGKSVIIDALCYAVYEEPLSDIKSIDSIINFTNKKDMYVTVEFEKDGNQYRIERGRATKDKRGKNFCEIKINGEDKTPAGGSKQVNQMIENIIGMPYEAFCRIVVFSAVNEPFLKLDAKKSREVIETLFGLTELTQKEVILKEYIKETNATIKEVQAKFEQREQSYLRYIQQLESADSRVNSWAISQDNKINELKISINELNSLNLPDILKSLDELETIKEQSKELRREITTTEQKLVSITNSINTWDKQTRQSLEQLNTDLSKYSAIDVDSQRQLFIETDAIASTITLLENEKKDLVREITATDKQITTCEHDISETQRELDHLNDATCPYCSQQFVDTTAKIKNATEKLDNLLATIESLTSKKQTFVSNLDNVDVDLTKNITLLKDKNKEKQVGSYDELNQIVSILSISQEKIKDLEGQTNPHTDQLNEIDLDLLKEMQLELENINVAIADKEKQITWSGTAREAQEALSTISFKQTQLDEAIKEVNPHISALDELIDNPVAEPDKSTLNELMDDLEHQKFLQKLLINKDSFVRKSLLSKSLPFLNVRLSDYLNKLGFRYKVEFTPQLTASISEFGQELEFGNMSNGQASRLNTALSFAFRDVLEQMHTPVNVCILDEILDVGLDAPGIVAATRILKQKSRDEGSAIFLISHREEIENMFDKKLTIQMDKRFSYVVK